MRCPLVMYCFYEPTDIVSAFQLRDASKGEVVGVTTPALFGKEGNWALFSHQASRLDC